ncbi:RelA/SpoT domain protein [Aeromicrobium marinum DSM 15272]|uniref:RelA/SpoT domain protein n=1 Tax=Aeromicrobium marinum DSM 15272 TaxID=585531 RepID=E2SBZ6_9ACTN|nr:DUF429 domain-containing protein [Aeromicrobium marinum]EFQ83282.1 RelA/SpoT domain protein [Aeromicrobium marinum DSM 15272]
MHLVGIDLAWGEKKPTGVAVLDPAGRLVHLSSQRRDADILEAVRPWVEGDCLVAVDAPLIVTNDTGNRPAERGLNADFARFDAGAHPVNRGKPEFADTPRGARLAEALGLDIHPASTSRRRAIEVYPHPATVALFRLGRILAYKNKPGRTLDGMRAQLLRLTQLLDGLADARPALHLDHPDWHALVEAVTSAGRKSELRTAEDQVDAVVCAYVAMVAAQDPGAVTTYGDADTGYIVTPTLPADHTPAPRARQQPVSRAVQRYAEEHPALVDLTAHYTRSVIGLLDEAGIDYLTVSGRAKSVASFATKAARTAGGRRVFTRPLTEITDQIGIRVITYVQSDVAAVAELLAEEMSVLEDRDMGRETAGEGRFGYASRHLLVAAGDLRPAQVQVRTVLQHAWAEFEHDIRYKGTIPAEHASDFDRRFTLAAGLLELADREFSTIRSRLHGWMRDQRPEMDAGDPRISPQELASFLAGRFTDAGWSRTDHYAWVSGLLLELGVTSLDELGGLLSSVDSEIITGRMEYQYPPGAVRRLDDALLAIFGQRYLQLTGNAHRQEALESRLAKLRTSPTD